MRISRGTNVEQFRASQKLTRRTNSDTGVVHHTKNATFRTGHGQWERAIGVRISTSALDAEMRAGKQDAKLVGEQWRGGSEREQARKRLEEAPEDIGRQEEESV